MLSAWEQLDSWMGPKLLEATPKHVREWVLGLARQNKVDQSHVVLFYVMKLFAPGKADEKVQVLNNMLNPSVCTNLRAAQAELLKWKESIRRVHQLGCSPPDLLLTYTAMDSNFSEVFNKAEPQLNARWITLKNSSGLPHRLEFNIMDQVAIFVEAELGALALMGGQGLNPGL